MTVCTQPRSHACVAVQVYSSPQPRITLMQARAQQQLAGLGWQLLLAAPTMISWGGSPSCTRPRVVQGARVVYVCLHGRPTWQCGVRAAAQTWRHATAAPAQQHPSPRRVWPAQAPHTYRTACQANVCAMRLCMTHGCAPKTTTDAHPASLLVVSRVDEHAADVAHQHGLLRSGQALEHLLVLLVVCLCLSLQQLRLVHLALLCQ